jgi:hypothetical protein
LLLLQDAFLSNASLTTLDVQGDIGMHGLDDLAMLFQAIAASPKLRTLCLDIKVRSVTVKPQKLSQLFANALKDCSSQSLERVTLKCNNTAPNPKMWNRHVGIILQFNHERRFFLQSAGDSDKHKLLLALMLAKRTNNHHYRYWLVRCYAGDLPRGESNVQLAE